MARINSYRKLKKYRQGRNLAETLKVINQMSYSAKLGRNNRWRQLYNAKPAGVDRIIGIASKDVVNHMVFGRVGAGDMYGTD